MRSFSRYALLGAMLLGVLFVAYSLHDQVDFNEHQHFDGRLARLGEIDGALNQNLLEARFRLIRDYDGFSEQLDEMKRTIAALDALPSFVPADRRESFRLKLHEFQQTLAVKEQLLEDFKSENAVLNNSLRYLPLASRSLVESLSTDEEGRPLVAPMNRLMQQVLVYCLRSADDEEPAIRQSLAQLAEWRARHPGHPQAAVIARVASHVSSVVSRTPKVEALTRQIVSLPTKADTEELLRLYDTELAGALHRTEVVRRFLQGACVLLLLGVAYTIYALDAANRTLERRVAARTVELSAENAQRKLAEEGHRKSERFLQSTLDSLSSHIAILDAGGTIVAVNAPWRKFAEKNEVHQEAIGIGMNYLAVCEAASGNCSNETVSIAAGIRRVMTGEETEFQLEYPCHSPREQRWFIVRVTCFHSEDSLHLVVAHENVTTRTLAEQHLRMQEAELRVLFDFIPAMICFKDTENRILRANKRLAEILGKSVAEIEGKSVLETFPEEAAKFYADDLEVIHSGAPKLGIIETFRNCGDQELWVQTDKVPVRDKDGRVVGLVAMALDITERRRAQSELESVHAQLLETSHRAGMAEVATGVLHNVGNVLNSVNVSATLVADHVRKSKVVNLKRIVALLESHASDMADFVCHDAQGRNLPVYLRQLEERLRQEQQTVLAEVEALRGNIEHIKDIVAMQQSYAKFSGMSEVLDLTDLVEDALRMNSSSLNRHDVQVIREFEKVPPVTVDKHKMLQILVNLVRNAKQACDDSGRSEKKLTLRVTTGNDHARVAVSDNGVGVSPENMTRIFAHGFTTKRDGHGFGLHSSALAAKEMGGSLQVQSAGEGQGATFTVELPLLPQKISAE